MELLTDELRRQLPPIRQIHYATDEDQRMIYGRFFTRRSGVSFYVAEGEPRQPDYLLWGFLLTPQYKFPLRFQITVARLQTKDWVGMECCERDENFQPARWGEIQRTIANVRQPRDA
jgi:hypothetical protein